MTVEFCAVTPNHYSWDLLGPPAATSVALAQSIAVVYASDNSYDTLSPHIPAVLPGGGTVWNRANLVHVLYTVKGSGVLSAVPESQLGSLSSDVALLGRCLVDEVIPYQPQQPSGAPDVSGAWSGGAVLTSSRGWAGGAVIGSFTAQSWTGGAIAGG